MDLLRWIDGSMDKILMVLLVLSLKSGNEPVHIVCPTSVQIWGNLIDPTPVIAPKN